MDASAQRPDLDAACDNAIATYFERVLPCFLTAHLRGGGYTLLAEMMRAHDAGDLLSICDTVTPSAKSLIRAARVRAQCPPRLTEGGLDAVFSPPTLGLFQRRGTTIAGEMLHSYREIDVSWEVSLFADTFEATVPPERWADELLLTIFHEYIHYFESFLLRSEQPLRSREEGHHGLAEGALSLDEARRRDRRVIRRKRVLWGCLIGVPLLIAAAVLLASIRIESEDDREAIRGAIAQNQALITQLQAIEAKRASIESRAARMRQSAEPALSVGALAVAARGACPSADVQAIEGLGSVILTVPGDLRACLSALHRGAPRAPIAHVNRPGLQSRILIKTLRGLGGLDGSEVRRPWAALHVTTDAGDQLRAALAESADAAQRLKVRVAPLAETAQTIAAFEAPPKPSLSVLLAGLPDDVVARGLRQVKGGYELKVDGPGAAAWVRDRHPPEGQVTPWSPRWVLVAAKSSVGLTNRTQHRAWFLPR